MPGRVTVDNLAALEDITLQVAQQSLPDVDISTVTAVAASATVVTLVAANVSRKGLIIYNDGSIPMYIKFGPAATTSSFTYKALGGDTFEMGQPIYTGIVTALWDSASGSARITQLEG